jgi:GWxTD domain-containing protein
MLSILLSILFEAAVRATLIAAAAPVALRLLRVRAAEVRHRVWTIVLLAMLLLPIWSAWGPEISLRVLPGTPSTASSLVVSRALGGPDREAMTPFAPTIEQAPPRATSTRAPSAPPVAERAGSWAAWLLGLYLAGLAALLTRLVIGTARVQFLVRGAWPLNGRLTSADIATPLTVGLFKPRVLMPEGWDGWPAGRLAAVLDHERAHVCRRDPLVQWLALLNRAVFWFHPLAWWLERRLATLAEEACDAAVLGRGHAPDAYSEHLLDLARMARRGRVPHVVGAPMPGGALPARIVKILEGRAARSGSRAVASGAVGLATLAALAFGAVTLAQDVSAPPLTPSADSFTALPEHWFEDDEWRLEVAPIMTPEEEQAYRSLRSMEERDRFIGAFWLRRDPTPGTLHNERRKEYERRIHYADEWFRSPESPGTFGYQTTRGTVYVLLGPPDSIEAAVEDGASYEYWRYSDVNDTGRSFTVRVALSHRFSCGAAYEIVEPAPTRIFRGFAGLGQNPPQPLEVRVYPLGLVTFMIPIEYGTVEHVRAALESEAGAAPVGRLFGFEFRLPSNGLPPDKRSIAVSGREGLNCTLPIPPGSYRLSAEADLFSGEHLTDSVAFDVGVP